MVTLLRWATTKSTNRPPPNPVLFSLKQPSVTLHVPSRPVWLPLRVLLLIVGEPRSEMPPPPPPKPAEQPAPSMQAEPTGMSPPFPVVLSLMVLRSTLRVPLLEMPPPSPPSLALQLPPLVPHVLASRVPF